MPWLTPRHPFCYPSADLDLRVATPALQASPLVIRVQLQELCDLGRVSVRAVADSLYALADPCLVLGRTSSLHQMYEFVNLIQPVQLGFGHVVRRAVLVCHEVERLHEALDLEVGLSVELAAHHPRVHEQPCPRDERAGDVEPAAGRDADAGDDDRVSLDVEDVGLLVIDPEPAFADPPVKELPGQRRHLVHAEYEVVHISRVADRRMYGPIGRILAEAVLLDVGGDRMVEQQREQDLGQKRRGVGPAPQAG